MEDTYFTVHYDPHYPYLARIIADAAQEKLEMVAKNLDYKLEKNRPFPLYVYRNHADFIKEGKLVGKEFTVGTTTSGSETIALDASGVFALPEIALTHEITHAVIFRLLGPNIRDLPLWANEGLAKYESEGFSSSDNRLIVDAAADGMLIPLYRLKEEFPEDKVDLAYAESSSAINYMITKYGKSAPSKLLHKLQKTGSFDKAMMSVTGKTSDQFTDEWETSVSRRYWPVKVTRTILAIVPIVMVVLVIIAFFVRRRQKRLAAQEWEWEQFEEAMRKQLGNDWWR